MHCGEQTMKKQTKKQETKDCGDANCPFHGSLKTRGQVLAGIVTKTGGARTVRIEFQRLYALPKYERFEKRRTRIQAHNPACINAQLGDKVKIKACRPISKTKNFVIIENESTKSK